MKDIDGVQEPLQNLGEPSNLSGNALLPRRARPVRSARRSKQKDYEVVFCGPIPDISARELEAIETYFSDILDQVLGSK